MNEKCEKLISVLLKSNSYMTSQQLAFVIGTSQRTIRNYIIQINNQGAKKVISSSMKGYKIVNRKIALEILSSEQSVVIPQSKGDRVNYILKKLLKNENPISIHHITESLFVSSSTVMRDFSLLKNICKRFYLKTYIESNHIYLEGTDSDKRSLLCDIIYDEIKGSIIDYRILEEHFPNLPIKDLSQILSETIKHNGIHLNDFSFINILLHLAIIIETRINTSNGIKGIKIEIKSNDYSSYNIVQQLNNSMERKLGVSLTPQEQKDIQFLILSNTRQVSVENIFSSNSKLVETMNELFSKIKEYYYIDLSNKSFQNSFFQHLEALLDRASKKELVKNPMVETLKINCPIIYEISSFIANYLQADYSLTIDESEVGFIALHIGSEISVQREEQRKLKCIFYTPSYLDLEENAIDKIVQTFHSSIVITHLKNISENDIQEFDLLITTIEIKAEYSILTVEVSPFIDGNDIKAIQQAIDQIRIQKKQNFLGEIIPLVFQHNLFYINPDIRDKNDLIKFMCNNLFMNGIVDKNFLSAVLVREKIASTSYGNIAIPHAVGSTAFQTKISVAILDPPMNWNGNRVSVVLLIAICDYDLGFFNELYETLVLLFLTPTIITRISGCNSFSSFLDIVNGAIEDFVY